MQHIGARDPHLSRAFTLLELVVTIIIVGMLAVLATLGYGRFVDGARDTQAREQLRSLSQLALAYSARNDLLGELSQPLYEHALTAFPDVVVPGTSAGGAGWSIIAGTEAPQTRYEFSVAFDTGIGTPINNEVGTRAAVVARSDSGRFFAEVMLAAPAGEDVVPGSFRVPEGATAADVLGGAVFDDVDLPYTETETGEDPADDPVTSPVSVTPRPDTDWLTCNPTLGDPAATVSDARIATNGDSYVWWSMRSSLDKVVGYKICKGDGAGGFELLASTGPGTADARTWVVRTNESHPNTRMFVITVLNDGNEYVSKNSCETKPAGGAQGWAKQPRGC